MNLAPRILAFIVFGLAGFLFPLLWLAAAYFAFTIYTDSRPRRRKEEDGRFPLISEADADWLQQVRNCTESPAEIAFLDAMVDAFKLVPRGRLLCGGNLTLRMQVEIQRYRLDFLVDETLVVEIDGAAWHSSDEAVERDRRRDAFLSEQGYTVLRIPARIALYQPAEAVRMVRERRPQAAERHERDNLERKQALRDGLRPANLVRSAVAGVDAVGRFAEKAHLAAERNMAAQEARAAELVQKQQDLLAEIRSEFPKGCFSEILAGDPDKTHEQLLAFEDPKKVAPKARMTNDEETTLWHIEQHRDRLRKLRDVNNRLASDRAFKAGLQETREWLASASVKGPGTR